MCVVGAHQFSFFVQEDVRKRHQQKRKREERENSGFRRQNKRGTNKKQKKRENSRDLYLYSLKSRAFVYILSHTHTQSLLSGKRRRDMVRTTTPGKSPSSGVEALLTPNRLNNATHRIIITTGKTRQ